jgi:hypothetical protein
MAKAKDSGSFVICDVDVGNFTSTAPNQFNARYAGGFRLIGGLLSLNDGFKQHVIPSDYQTLDANPTSIYNFTPQNNSVSLYDVAVTATTPTGDSQVIKTCIKIKNIGGVITVGNKFNYWDDPDPTLSSTKIEFAVSGGQV